MTPRLRATVLGLVLGVAAALVTAVAPATADARGGAVLVSPDGSTWSADLPAPLFDPAVRWVPGDSRTSSFYVENRGSTPAEVGLQVSAQDGDALLGPGYVDLRARVAGGPWTPVGESVGPPLDSIAIGVGESRRVDVRAGLRAAADNLTRTSVVALTFVVRLSEKVPPATTIPDTGAPGLRGPLLVAALCLGGGLALVRRTAGARHG